MKINFEIFVPDEVNIDEIMKLIESRMVNKNGKPIEPGIVLYKDENEITCTFAPMFARHPYECLNAVKTALTNIFSNPIIRSIMNKNESRYHQLVYDAKHARHKEISINSNNNNKVHESKGE